MERSMNVDHVVSPSQSDTDRPSSKKPHDSPGLPRPTSVSLLLSPVKDLETSELSDQSASHEAPAQSSSGELIDSGMADEHDEIKILTTSPTIVEESNGDSLASNVVERPANSSAQDFGALPQEHEQPHGVVQVLLLGVTPVLQVMSQIVRD